MAAPPVVPGWQVRRTAGTAADLHDRPMPEGEFEPVVWIHRVERPALVLGSAQRLDLLTDRALANDLEVCTRRSGGGMVLLDATDCVWIDVLIPRSDPRWSDDVSTAFHWVGEAWADAIDELGLGPATVHHGRARHRENGRFVCFAGLGAGEVTIPRSTDAGPTPSKVVGLSQRRTRAGARFQTLLLRRWSPTPLIEAVRAEAWPAELDPRSVRAGFDPGATDHLSTERLEAAFLAALAQTQRRERRNPGTGQRPRATVSPHESGARPERDL